MSEVIAEDGLRFLEHDRVMLALGVTMDDRMEARAEPDADVTCGALDPTRPVLDRGMSADLVDTVIHSIVPRLLLASQGDALGSDREVDARGAPTPAEVSALAELAVAQDVRGAMAQIEAMRTSGSSLETILLDLITPAGRLLGEQWLSDDRSFTEVALGAGTLQRVLTTLRQRSCSPPSRRGLVLLMTPPGEQHTLAIHVLGDLLRHAGWDAIVEPNLAEDELVERVASVPVVMVGISVSCSSLVDPLAGLIERVRGASIDREILFMLGGATELMGSAGSVGAVYCANAQAALIMLAGRGELSP